MSFLKSLCRFIMLMCLFFVIGISAVLIIGALNDKIVVDADGAVGMFINLLTFASFACFSAFLSLAFCVSKALTIDTLFKVLIHFAISYVGFYVSFFAITGNYSLLGSFIYLSFAYIICYAVICAIVFAIKGLSDRIANSSKDYKEIYK